MVEHSIEIEYRSFESHSRICGNILLILGLNLLCRARLAMVAIILFFYYDSKCSFYASKYSYVHWKAYKIHTNSWTDLSHIDERV